MVQAHGQSWQDRRIAFALVSAGISAALGLIQSLVTTANVEQLPLLDQRGPDVAQLVVSLSVWLALALTLVAFRRLVAYDEAISPVEREAEQRRRQWIGRTIVTLELGLLAFTLTTVAMLIGAALFREVTFSRFGVVAGVTLYSAMFGGLLVFWVVTLNSSEILRIGIALLVAGLGLAMALAAEPRWWTRSISFLGHDSAAGYVFNLTVIFGGQVMLAVALDLLATVRIEKEAGRFPLGGYRLLRFSLPGICMLLSAIGLFPTTITPLSNLIHDVCSHGMALFIIALMFVVTWVIPIYPRRFHILSMAFGVMCTIILLTYFLLRFLNFVAMEIFLLVACWAWVLMLRYYTLEYIRHLPAGKPVEPKLRTLT